MLKVIFLDIIITQTLTLAGKSNEEVKFNRFIHYR